MSSNCLYRVSAKALIKNSDGKLLFVEEKAGNGFELPGGGIENGETFKEALLRELREELSIPKAEVSSYPAYVWIINGEVIWLLFEVIVDEEDDIKASNHVSSAGYLDVQELLSRDSISGLGYCCRLYHEDLMAYVD